MRVLLELCFLFLISLFSEFLSRLIPFPIPSSIIALVIMLILFSTKLLKEEHLEKTSSFLLDHMSFFYIPPCIGILNHLALLKSAWWKILVISVVSTIVVFALSLYSVVLTQKVIALCKRRRKAA